MLKVLVYRLLNEKNEVADEIVVSDPSQIISDGIGGYGNDGKYYQCVSYEACYASSFFEKKNVGLRIVVAEIFIDTSYLNFK